MADPNIFAPFMRPVKSMQDYAADYDAAEQNKLILAAKRMEMQNAERTAMEDRDFAELTRSSGGDLNALYRAAMGKGLYGRAQGVQKSIDERSAADLTRRKTEAEIAAQRRKEADEIYSVYETARSRFLGDPNISKQKVVASLQELAAVGRLPADLVEKLTANLSDDPNELRADIERGDVSRLSPEKRLELFAPKWSMQGTGARQVPIQSNPRAPGFNANQPLQMEQTPDSVASNARQAAEGAANRAQQERNSRRIDARARDTAARADGTAIAELGGPAQSALTKQFGKASAGYRWKADGSQEPIPGGPADQKATTQQAGKETVDSVVAQLRQSYDSLDTGGGITSTDQGAISNLGRRLSQSAVGQFAGGAVGSTNQKERDAIAQARPLLLQAIMKATGMSAKQMDSNAELKLYLATATDPTLSLQANREALDRIAELYGGGATPKQPPKPAGAGLSAQEQKELDELRARFGGRK